MQNETMIPPAVVPSRRASTTARATAVLLLASALVVALYLLASRNVYGLGFPLDDAWIHQTYARNLGELGQWAFLPGQISAGSTAPLWTVLLALGYLLHIPYLVWAYLLGGLSLVGLAWLGERLFRGSAPAGNLGRFGWVPWAGIFLAGEWHLAWAAVSGMETLLAGLFVLLAWWLVRRASGRGWLWVGLLIGLSVWVRPDGITLLGPAGLTLILAEPGWRARVRSIGWLALGTAVCFAPYLLFNYLVQGSIWPNTFYAKQAEYAVQREVPLLLRFINEVKLPLIGSGALLLPGFLVFTWRSWVEKRWTALSFIIWFLGYALLYALRLPVTYQYGRYFMPALPVYFVSGLAGLAYLLRPVSSSPPLRVTASDDSGAIVRLPLSPSPRLRVMFVLQRVWLLSLAAAWLGFAVIGANRYAQDVAIIETEMVETARWVSANTAPGDLIAAHDIGAMGYFSQRRLVDLAGLVSPEVIPFLRDETRLAEYLDQQGVAYLVTFPGWYSMLDEGKKIVFTSQAPFAPASGGEHMVVYRWRK
jgi:hypothetical protein